MLDTVSSSIPVSSPAPLPTGPTEKPTLLIVDDEEGPRQSLRIVFKEDYNLIVASDGQRAVELAKQNKIHVAVLDIRMAGISGIDLLEKLKAIDPHIEIIMLTAYETIDTIRQALRLGACDYLNKPFDLASMRAAVANAMERRALSDEIRVNNQTLGSLKTELDSIRLQEEITRTRGEIYASIIHDINGPLTVISGFIQIINQRIINNDRVEGEDLDMVRDRLKRITKQVSSCIEISQRYLSFMRQDPSGNVRVGLNQILNDLRELMKAHPSAEKSEFFVHNPTDEILVQINGTDLIQILLNLSINGLQSTEMPHQVEVRAQILTRPELVREIVDGPNDRVLNREGFKSTEQVVLLSVRDTGPGIPPELMAKIFEPYFTTKAPTKGTGLGLSIVHRLIREAKGLLHLNSQAGEGTTFNIYLPAQPPS